MNKNLSLFVLALLVIHSSAHKCVHDEIKHVPKKLDLARDNSYLEFFDVSTDSLPASYQPIRILADYSGISDKNTPVSSFIIKKLMPAVIEYFQQLLSVIPEQKYIKLKDERCYDAKIPTEMKNVNLEADLILFVVSNPEKSSSTLASAIACFLHPDTGRPLIGRINLNPSALSLEPSAWKYQFMTAVHEMIHVLGLSSLLYEHFVDPATRMTLNINKTRIDVDWRGVAGKILTTPRVTETARKYFNCSNITGLELENEGGPESKGSHWERRVLGNELMTSSIDKDPRLSSFTLALLEDSGWYKANYSVADSLVFGRDAGCAFVFQSCIDKDTKKARFQEFCSERNENLCSVDHAFCGICIREKRDSLPAAFNYFGDDAAGFDPYADGCPTPLPYPNADCTDAQGQAPGEPGPESHCFLWTSNVTKKQFPACFKYQCEYSKDGKSVLYITNNQQKVQCLHEGAQLVQNVSNITGFLTCPEVKYICDKNYEVINPNPSDSKTPESYFPLIDVLDNFLKAYNFAERISQCIVLILTVGLGVLAY